MEDEITGCCAPMFSEDNNDNTDGNDNNAKSEKSNDCDCHRHQPDCVFRRSYKQT